MRITKFSHSCVRVEAAGAVIVIDPGTLAESESLTGVDAVLITHEHPDHLDTGKLADLAAASGECPIYAHPAICDSLAETFGALRGIRVHSVLPGDSFVAAGFSVRAFGGLHAEIHPELPRVPNLGYFIADAGIYHPGDSFDVPTGVAVETLFVPVAGTWLRLTDCVDFVRSIAPTRAYPIHDALLSEAGHEVVTGNMRRLCPCPYQRLRSGECAIPG